MGDENRIKYILTCLIQNAIERNRQSSELGHVTVKASVSEEDKIDIKMSGEETGFAADW
jgi:hypothetical protein